MNLLNYKEVIEKRPIHIATVNKDNNPNLSVAADIIVLDDNRMVICISEMNNTQNNIMYNENVVITSFNEDWVGLRIFGKGEFFDSGEYYDLCKNTFFGNGQVTPAGATKPKGALLITVTKIEEFK